MYSGVDLCCVGLVGSTCVKNSTVQSIQLVCIVLVGQACVGESLSLFRNWCILTQVLRANQKCPPIRKHGCDVECIDSVNMITLTLWDLLNQIFLLQLKKIIWSIISRAVKFSVRDIWWTNYFKRERESIYLELNPFFSEFLVMGIYATLFPTVALTW